VRGESVELWLGSMEIVMPYSYAFGV